MVLCLFVFNKGMMLLLGQTCRIEAFCEAWSPRQKEFIVCMCLRFKLLIRFHPLFILGILGNLDHFRHLPF